MLASKLTAKTARSCQILTAPRRPRWIQKPQPAAAWTQEKVAALKAQEIELRAVAAQATAAANH